MRGVKDNVANDVLSSALFQPQLHPKLNVLFTCQASPWSMA